jgi:DNA repair protein RecN (Recombination protein N)
MNVNVLCNKNSKFNSVKELINSALINFQEAVDELGNLQKQWDIDPERLAFIEDRLTTVHDIARKHRTQPELLTQIAEAIHQKIYEFENIETQIDTLKLKQQEFLSQYNVISQQLTQKRLKAGKKLDGLMSNYIQELGMKGAFRTTFAVSEKIPHPLGNEQIEFEVITNPGQEFLPLQKVVSGGELSRISLALQTLIAKNEGVPTLIFDEVDTGIGGKTAHQVGKMLRELGENLQVLCITHLPQVAASGHHHYKVEKVLDKTKAQTQMRLLPRHERIEEIARMLSGAAVTEQTLAHAEELLND